MGNLTDYRKVKKVSHAGRSFGSKLEAALFDELWLGVQSDLYSDLRQQVEVRLTRAQILYKPDFSVLNNVTNEIEYFEAKGFPTPVFQIKKRLWKSYGPGKLHIYGGSAKYLRFMETVIPKGFCEEE